MANQEAKSEVFNLLKPLLREFSDVMSIEKDESDNYYLNTLKAAENGKPNFFGAVQIKKNYVSFHLMPIYVNPSLLDSLSESLKKRMQGKSCFNFKHVDQDLFLELQALIRASYEFYVEDGRA